MAFAEPKVTIDLKEYEALNNRIKELEEKREQPDPEKMAEAAGIIFQAAKVGQNFADISRTMHYAGLDMSVEDIAGQPLKIRLKYHNLPF